MTDKQLIKSNNYSLQSRLTRQLLGWALLMTVIPGIAVYFDAVHEVDEVFDAGMVQTAKVLNRIVTRDALAAQPGRIVDSVLAQDIEPISDGKHHHYEKKLAFQIWDDSGLVLKSRNAPNEPLLKLETGFHELEINEELWLAFAHFSDSEQWWVVIAEQADIRGELVQDITIAHVIPIIIFIPLLLLAVSWSLKHGFHPLRELRRHISGQDSERLSAIPERNTPDEVAVLIAALNELLERLRTAYEQQRQFVSDVAHELRTPLSGMLIQTENLLRELNEPSAEISLISSKRAIQRLSHLVNQLLASSRSSITLTDDNKQTIQLDELFNQLIAEQQHAAEAKQINIDVKLSSCCVNGNEPNLASLFSNLLTNAIRYTPDSGKISIDLHCEGDTAKFFIADSGIGIPAEYRDKVKDRFYRINREQADGSGLGLSIVNSVAEQMDWQWEMHDSKLGGIEHRFSFQLK